MVKRPSDRFLLRMVDFKQTEFLHQAAQHRLEIPQYLEDPPQEPGIPGQFVAALRPVNLGHDARLDRLWPVAVSAVDDRFADHQCLGMGSSLMT